ncbi:MAG TPA: cysteine desulfurase NifS [Candidatus Avichristensenella intestinipullorum]|uniref:Cysteine desulfurase IscS n=1 Tax=Candidatus Avichristensenella intestinipullorum TaxID=2840693 RepID=A0A9D1CJC2_9FIRM|nr:cysteine desulfurase NifS [Candidatus Avichristensenella intestinipullorum]
MERIYMDNAATTRVKDEVFEAMLPYFKEMYGNPSSIHSFGREAKKAVEYARGQVARAINAQKEDIYFTGGGTEADNWIVKGAAFGQRRKGNHIITSAIEHHALLHTCQWLEKQGFRVTYLPVDGDGLVNPEDLEKAITKDTILVSIMFANNEIGTLQPIAELSRIAHAHGAIFHTDAVQAVGAVPIDVQAMGIDALSMAAHKFYGPKGVGALYIRRGVRIDVNQQGGAQERSRRGGTENLPGIVGMGKAIEMATENLPEHMARQTALRDKLIDGILERIPEVRLNGHRTKRLPNNVNVSIRYIEGEALLLRLDLAGVAASSGSACTSGSLDPSHVLLGIGLPHEIAHGSLRLTLGDFNTEAEVDYVLDKLPDIVRILRDMSPLFHQEEGGKVLV